MRSSSPNRSHAGKFHYPDLVTIALCSILVLYFLVRNLYFAFNIGTGISPDEMTWFGKCVVFSKAILLPIDSPDSYEYGLVTHIPYLYFWLMGKLIHLNFFAVSDLVFLRCVNICIGLAALWFAWKTISILTESIITRLLFMVMCTNTLMLTFLYSFVSYDNLVNFFAIAALFFLISYLKNRSLSHLLACMIVVLAGCLTKVTFLPYALLIFVAFLIKEYKNLVPLLVEFKSCFLFKDARRSVLMALCLFLLALNIDVYGTNFIKFHRLEAPVGTVLGLENALQYRIFAKYHVIWQFENKRLSLDEATQMAHKYIKDRGDLAGALGQLRRVDAENKKKQPERLDRLHYAFPWIDLNMSRAYGIAGHKFMWKTGSSLAPYTLIYLLGAALLIRRFRLNDMNGNAVVMLVLAGGYTLILMQSVNYNSYLTHGALGLATSGRYLFPVLYAGYALLANYLTNSKSKTLNAVVATVVAAIFIAGDFPWFLRHVTPAWYFAG